MAAAIEHRGPDSRGVYSEGPVGLAMQRLSVIDLETGDQPQFTEDGSVAVMLNGEIYNYRELRERLMRNGHTLATRSDTEVIAHLYEEEGPDLVQSLEGMFAFSLWDSRRKVLLLGRDRLGKKPLFYAFRGGTLTWGSELGGVLQDREISREIDPQAIDAYLTYGYVPAPMSAFAAVRKLPPASTLVLAEGGTPRIERYWRLDYSNRHAFASQDELHERIRDEIRTAVRKRLISDVPLGAFLSGGIDSSAIVAAMAEASAGPVKTFSIGFDDEEFNELPIARLVADRFGTDHHELMVRPDAVEILPKLVRHYGEPFADHSAIPSFYLAEMARKHVTVALNGDGGDESFAGYGRYLNALTVARADVIPRPIRRMVGAAARQLPGDGRLESTRNRIRRVATMLPLDASERYLLSVSRFGWAQRDNYTPEFRSRLDDNATAGVVLGPWAESSANSLVDRMLDVDLTTHLAGDLLVKMDIATMAHSLEARSPLLDHKLMEFAAGLAPEHKAVGREKKIALRGALRPWLPPEVLDRPKRGFQVPMVRWLRGELGSVARDALLASDAAVTNYLPASAVRTLLNEHAAGSADHSTMIWSLLVLEQWHGEFATGTRPSVEVPLVA
jgi:asparagine synthase (glutamine-hydrolysing)